MPGLKFEVELRNRIEAGFALMTERRHSNSTKSFERFKRFKRQQRASRALEEAASVTKRFKSFKGMFQEGLQKGD